MWQGLWAASRSCKRPGPSHREQGPRLSNHEELGSAKNLANLEDGLTSGEAEARSTPEFQPRETPSREPGRTRPGFQRTETVRV